MYLNFRFSIKKIVFLLFGLCFFVSVSGQTTVSFKSSDVALESAFNWAKATALSYKGNPRDPVGAWYEAALPGRYSFCIRDVSHQCIGAEILGLGIENKNMLYKFVSHISKSKNWCSFWEINKWNKPTPVDYKNDRAFWYNLNANFDLIYACWRLYQWTGDKSYISNPVFVNFFKRSLNEYIKDWKLEADSLLTRPSMPNEPEHFNKSNNYYRSRGLPSYVENFPHLKMSSDLISAIYQGFASYSHILRKEGKPNESRYYAQKAEKYKSLLNSKWWNAASEQFYSFYTDEGNFDFGKGDGIFLLWFDAITSKAKRLATIHNITSSQLNVETTSYLPYLLCLNGYGEQARKYILYLSNPATPRRSYPEVSYSVIEGIVQGLMGIKTVARSQTICTFYRGKNKTTMKINNLPILNSKVNIEHFGHLKTTFQNNGTSILHWNAEFSGKHLILLVNGKKIKAKTGKDLNGNIFSFVKVTVHPKQKAVASVNYSEIKN